MTDNLETIAQEVELEKSICDMCGNVFDIDQIATFDAFGATCEVCIEIIEGAASATHDNP